MKIEDLYWLAGYLEGEGSFVAAGTKQSAGSTTIGIVVQAVDLDVIQRVGLIFGREPYAPKLYEYEKSFKGPRQQQYRVNLYGMPTATLMMELYPIMGERRKEQIKKTLFGYKKLTDMLPQGG